MTLFGIDDWYTMDMRCLKEIKATLSLSLGSECERRGRNFSRTVPIDNARTIGYFLRRDPENDSTCGALSIFRWLHSSDKL